MSFQNNARGVRRFARLMKFAQWMQGLPNKLAPPPVRLMQIGSAFWQSRALYVAAKLDIAGLLVDGPLPATDIAARAKIQPDAVHRLLRLLAALGIFEEVAPGTFANNPLSVPLMEDSPDSVRAMILMHNSPAMSRPWYEQLESCVRDGGVPFAATHGQALFDYMDSHPEFDALFSRAMESVEALSSNSFVQDFAWERFERVIDIGGSKGGKSIAILTRHARLNALVVDRAQVIQDAENHWADRAPPALMARIRFQAGDLLAAIPQAASDKDIYLLSAVLHGFDDASCTQALLNLRQACGHTNAHIALIELVLPERGADLFSAAADMQMFMGTGGRERTLAQWTALFEQSGLALKEQVSLQSFSKILVLKPK